MDKVLDKFDYGIDNGQIIDNSNYIWCTSERGLQIRNLNQKLDNMNSTRPTSSFPYHHFGILNNDQFEILCVKDFKYFNQYYLLISLKNADADNILCVYHVASSKVVCAFNIDYQVINIDIFVTTYPRDHIISKFTVCAFCGCIGGAIYVIDVTPRQELLSNEYSPLDLNLYLVNDENLEEIKLKTIKAKKVFGILLNDTCVNGDNFCYTMPNDEIMAKIPSETVKITSLKYEKQIDSLLVGFNFGCFQIWNMKALNIESSSAYAHLNRPIIGFSLLEPQNDPKKCLYLLIAHSSLIENKQLCNSLGTYEIEDDDENDADSSFILLYQLNYEKKILFKSYANDQQDIDYESDYYFYENLINCVVAFEHDFTSNTLSYSNINECNYENEELNICDVSVNYETSLSKIISIQTLKVHNNGLDADLACLCWTLIKNTNSNSSYYLTLFNLNNWYMQCMPSRLHQNDKNLFLNNFILNFDLDYSHIKSVNIIESNIKKTKLCNDDSILSIYLEILIISSFMSIKYTIKPVEEQIRNFINKQDDLFQYQDKIYNLLYRYNLLPTKSPVQEKFLAILNYLLENSELYAIIKSLKRLEHLDTSILSSCSLKTVLDWTWMKFKEIKYDLTIQSRKLIEQTIICDYKLKQTILNDLRLIKNLIKIYELFIQLNKSNDGYVELNKKLNVLKSFELYCEHINLCLEYNLLPEKIDPNSHTSSSKIFSFSMLQDSWHEKRKAVLLNTSNKYTFGFLIDCLLSDCKSYALVSKLIKFSTYPPKSIHEILEIFLECNLTNDIKQLLFLYFLIDIKSNISTAFTKKIDNLITSYYKNDSIKTNLFNLAMGFYHLDDQNAEESYEYFRNCDINYLQINEKYRILYNLAYLNKWNKALEFLWLFNNILDDFNVKDNNNETTNELTEINSKLLISIYLSNKLINEAYEIVKNFSGDKKLYKQLIVYFLVQSENFNLWKPIMDFFTSNQSMLQILYSYLEAKQDLNSICTAIDLYLTNHMYTQAIQLHDKYARQIHNSQYSYISSMIEAVKEMNLFGKTSKTQTDQKVYANQLNITSNDIKDAKLNFPSKTVQIKLSKRCRNLINDETDADHVKNLSLFDIDTIRPLTTIMSTKLPPTSTITPQKPNISILKSNNFNVSNSSISLNNLTPSKSVKFKILEMRANEQNSAAAVETKEEEDDSEPFEIVNLKEKTAELHKCSSVASLESAMSTISSRSALNLPARLADLENDEKLMKNAEKEKSDGDSNDIEMSDYGDDESIGPQLLSNDASTASSASSHDSTISSKSAQNIEGRLAEVQTPIVEDEKDEKEEENIEEENIVEESNKAETNVVEEVEKNKEENVFKRPTGITKVTTEPSHFMKISSVTSVASTISSKSGADLAERLQDFESHTIEEDFRPLENLNKETTVKDQYLSCVSIDSLNSARSTMSSQSARNLERRLKDFENESVLSDDRTFNSGTDTGTNEFTDRQAENEQNTTLQDPEAVEKEANSETQLKSRYSSETFQTNKENIEKSSNIDSSPSISFTTVTPISANLTNICSQATSISTDDRRMDDEIIFSISDNEDNDRNSSFTSISSKCTTNTELSTLAPNFMAESSDYADVTLTKSGKRKSVGRRSKAATAAAKEIHELEAKPTDGPVTRSKLKALSNKSIDEIPSQELSYTTTTRRYTRSTRSMTRSPSPTNSVISTASTTVARNSIKRRGSNRIKKPNIILSPTNILEQQKIEEQETEQSETASSSRYNLRSRMKTPQKNPQLETLVESAAKLTPTLNSASKKGRKSVRKNPLYKIDETETSNNRTKADTQQDNDNDFLFSCPRDANVEEKSKKLLNDSDNEMNVNNDDEGEHDSSFTFSPPHSNLNK